LKRGVLYIVWGDKIETLLQRSIASVKKFYPDLPIEIRRPDGQLGLLEKAEWMLSSPFETTLYLDADTVIVGNLDQAFDTAEMHGLACCICECPWMRRYGIRGDLLEYNTGVLFFTNAYIVTKVFKRWRGLASEPPASNCLDVDGTRLTGPCDDQYGFARAVHEVGMHPFILPLNYNYRPRFQRTFFAPLKIWHSPTDVPEWVQRVSQECESGKRLVTFCDLYRGYVP
jgi:hypothetical protein